MKNLRNLTLAATLLVVPALSACGGGDSGGASPDNPKEILVATGNIYAPFAYQDQSGNPAGYDVEVLKAVDEKLPQYNFTYESMEMTQILVSVQQGRADIAAHQWTPNPEREKTYLFGRVPYTDQSLFIASSKKGPKYETLKELEGKKMVQAPGTERMAILEQYNAEEAGTPIELGQLNASWEESQVAVDSQTYDATLATWYDVTQLGKDVLQLSDEPVKITPTYFVYHKDETELQEAVDGALEELGDDGTLTQISEKVLGSDLSPKAQG